MIRDDRQYIAAVILAAGKSSRMGQTKALLKIDGHTFLESILKKLQKAGVNDILIVLGNDAGKIRDKISLPERCILIKNFHPEQGPLSSIHLAIMKLKSDINGFLLILVDHPLVSQTTYELIMNEADPQKIVIPVYNNKNGHPVYFGRNFFNDLLNAPLNKGARYVVHKYPEYVQKVDVQDAGILRDIDLPEDYEKYISGIF
jgi:molybdenum cofactor cytidylyltransferase